MSRRYTVVRDEFGTSMPTVPLPGTGARMRTFSARIAIATLFDSDEIFSTRTPAAGYNSNSVTVGPLVTSPDSTSMPNSCKRLAQHLRAGLQILHHIALPRQRRLLQQIQRGQQVFLARRRADASQDGRVAAAAFRVSVWAPRASRPRFRFRRAARPRVPLRLLLRLEFVGDLLDQRRRAFVPPSSSCPRRSGDAARCNLQTSVRAAVSRAGSSSPFDFVGQLARFLFLARQFAVGLEFLDRQFAFLVAQFVLDTRFGFAACAFAARNPSPLPTVNATQ